MTLDLPTVVILTALSAGLMGASILLASQMQSSSEPAMTSLGRSCLLQSLGWVLLGLRDSIPDLLSILGSNFAFLFSGLCIVQAVNVFLNGSPLDSQHPASNSRRALVPGIPNALWLVGLLYSLALLYFSFYQVDMSARIIASALLNGIFSTVCALRLLGAQPLLKSRRVVGIGFGLISFLQVFRIAMALIAPPRGTSVFTALASQTGTLLCGHIAVVMLTFLFVLMIHDRTARDLRALVTHDYLTGVFNRSAFEGFSRQAIEQARRSGEALSLLLFDVDHFKNINDTLGHLTGDVALRTLTDIAAQKLRSQDILGRYGGEEFAVLLPATDSQGALLVAERLREGVAESEFRDEGTTFCLTLSLGIAELSPGGQMSTEERLAALFRAADGALYEAKRAGRNRTLIAKPDAEEPSAPQFSQAA